MNISSGISLANGSIVIGREQNGLWLSRKDSEPYNLIWGYEDIRFLAASPYGEYLAFWSISGESFQLMELSGVVIWSAWMNSDKTIATGVKFSASGDAVACFYHFDGVPGVFFCDIEHGFSTIFGCCGRPIGHDSDLRYFVLSFVDRYEYDGLPFYEVDPFGIINKLSLEAASAKLDNGPVILDRNRRIVAQPPALKEDWDGLAIQTGMTGFVIQRGRNLSWFSGDSDTPEVTINDCLPESERHYKFCKILSVNEDNALIQISEKATVVNRNHGVIWTGDNLISTELRGNRVLAQYSDGTVEVINSDGSRELKYSPPAGFFMAAADIVDDVLYIAQIGRKHEVCAYTLHNI
jgi:hypothetical protein